MSPAGVSPVAATAKVLDFPQYARSQARHDIRRDRFRAPHRFGNLDASTLFSVMQDLDKGQVDRWSDLVDHALDDSTVASLNTTRNDRVVQADYIVEPSERGDDRLARQAAEHCGEAIELVGNWDDAWRDLFHAIPLGFSAQEEHWVLKRRRYYVDWIEYIPGNEFRYGRNWDLRYYNRGLSSGEDSYGEILWPNKWIVHTHRESPGRPNRYGLMRKAIWRWMFLRWGDKAHTLYLEKHGHPTVSATVGPNTPDAVREQVLTDLEAMSYDHIFVAEEGTVINVTESNGTGSTVHTDYLTTQRGELSKLWLGTSDAVEPGANGNQAAVSTRAGVALDPRMVMDGKRACTTIRNTFFRHALALNTHLFGVQSVDDIPIPHLRLKTADDEVVRDQSDKQEELDAEANAEGREAIEVRSEPQPADQGATPTPGGSPKPPPPDAEQPQLTMFADPAPKARPRKGGSALARALRGEL